MAKKCILNRNNSSLGSIDESVLSEMNSFGLRKWFANSFILPFVTIVVHESLHRARKYRIRKH